MLGVLVKMLLGCPYPLLEGLVQVLALPVTQLPVTAAREAAGDVQVLATYAEHPH